MLWASKIHVISKVSLTRFYYRWPSERAKSTFIVGKRFQKRNLFVPGFKIWPFVIWRGWCSLFRSSPFGIQVQDFNKKLSSLLEDRMFENLEFEFKKRKDDGLQMDCISYSIFLQHLGIRGNTEKMFEVYEEMKQRNIRPDVVIYGQLMSKIEDISTLETLFREMEQFRIIPDVYIFQLAAKLYNSKGDLSKLLELLPAMKKLDIEPNLVIHSIILGRLQSNQSIISAELQYRYIFLCDMSTSKGKVSWGKYFAEY
jgi:pentatricopeptide repeat protein